MTGIGGSENHLRILLPALVRAGVDARLTILVEPDRTDFLPAYRESLRSAGVIVESLLIRRHLDPALVLDLRRHVESVRPDLVHTHLIHADVHATPAARWAGVAVVSSRHANDAFRRNRVIGLAMRGISRLQRRIIAISRAVARYTTEAEGVPPERLDVVHYGLAVPPLSEGRRAELRREWGLAEGEPLLAMVGRLVPLKAHDVLLAAMAQLTRRSPGSRRVRLAIVGDGPTRSVLEGLIRELGLQSVAFLAGFRGDVLDVMRASDLCVHSSRTEGFGLVLLEAMAAARPVVACAVDAIPEIVEDGRSGLLVPPDDPDRLADAIELLLDDPARAASMGRRGREVLEERFGLDRMVDATLAVYRRALEGAEPQAARP